MTTWTREEFNKFQEGCVEENTNTASLVRRLLSDDYADKVIVCTIQKLGLALDENSKRNKQQKKDGRQTYKEQLEPLRDQLRVEESRSGDVASGVGQTCDDARRNRIPADGHDDRAPYDCPVFHLFHVAVGRSLGWRSPYSHIVGKVGGCFGHVGGLGPHQSPVVAQLAAHDQ